MRANDEWAPSYLILVKTAETYRLFEFLNFFFFFLLLKTIGIFQNVVQTIKAGFFVLLLLLHWFYIAVYV